MTVPSDLINTVFNRTREGKLAWEELSQDSYHTGIGSNYIVIERRGNSYFLQFTNAYGKELDSVSSSNWEVEGVKKLEELYEVVRRQVLKVDENLLDIKRTLDSL